MPSRVERTEINGIIYATVMNGKDSLDFPEVEGRMPDQYYIDMLDWYIGVRQEYPRRIDYAPPGEKAINLLAFAVQNKSKFIEFDPDGIKAAWIKSAEEIISERISKP